MNKVLLTKLSTQLAITMKRLAVTGLTAGVLLLGGCVEGVGTALQLADGIGGTGISVGRLTGFGSVYVNGIHFNTDNAQFVRDNDNSSAQSDFNIGEIVRVEGKVNADGKTGTASKVIYSDVIQGLVTKAATGKTLSVMEQTVTTDQLTVFHGFRKLSELKTDNMVEVSGYSNANGNVYATSIKLLSEDYNDGDVLEVDGAVKQLNIAAQTFRLNGLTVNYAQATFTDLTRAELRDGLYLAVSARQKISNGVLMAAELIKLDDAPDEGVGYEIEGLVSYFLSASYFEIDGYPISTNTATTFEGGSAADIHENNLLIVSGIANAQGIIVAESIKLSGDTTNVYLEANLAAIDPSNSSISILGQTVAINNHTLLSDDTTDDFIELNLGEFVVGEAVYIAVQQDSAGQYTASRLSRVAPIETLYLSGQPQGHDVGARQLELFGNTIITDADTIYQDADLHDLSATVFFERVDGEAHIGVVGTEISGGYILAESLTFEVE